MQLKSSSAVLSATLFLLTGGMWISGCGSNASNLFFSSGLLNLGVGANPGGGPLPSPTDTATPDQSGGNDGGGATTTTICITFFNESDQDARVDFFASDDASISFSALTSVNHIVNLPEADQGCIDAADLTGNLSLTPRILDGGRLSYQIDCVLAASMAFGALNDSSFVVGTEDDIFGPLRQGVDFNCGDNLNIAITDNDQDENLEIGFQ
jgi:hypothetical protein